MEPRGAAGIHRSVALGDMDPNCNVYTYIYIYIYIYMCVCVCTRVWHFAISGVGVLADLEDLVNDGHVALVRDEPRPNTPSSDAIKRTPLV